MLLPWFGVRGQEALAAARVLVVGAGGLGSPALLYLAAAGVGTLGVCDRDAVDASNLHRQVLHTTAAAEKGTPKVESAAVALGALNPSIKIVTHGEGLTPRTASALVAAYDLILDATDNAPARYLLSDAAARARIPLVSGAALGGEGQLSVYCGPAASDTPCYRCLFPAAPQPGACGRCADAGVLGPVPGVIGVLQAVEAIKVLTGVGEPLTRRLLLFDALSATVRTVRLRARNPACPACGDAPTLDPASFDYAGFTGAPAHDAGPEPLRLLGEGDRVDAPPAPSSSSVAILDVRPAAQWDLGRLPGSVSLPFRGGEDAAAWAEEAKSLVKGAGRVVVVCRRGNDSQRAVVALRESGCEAEVVDLRGGVSGWAAGGGRAVFPGY
jgi:adenylyltransferase and sulfurtransferase